MLSASRRYGLAITALVLSLSAQAARATDCEIPLTYQPLTLKTLRERSAALARERYKTVPAPAFENIEVQSRIEQVGVTGLRALRDFLSNGASFISTPAPTSGDAVAVDLVDEGRSFPVHLDVEFRGRRTSTAVYVSLPRPKILSAGDYLVGKEYPVVLIQLHGGGTPTATGRNGMSIGKELGKRGIPVLGLDLPGHGRATRSLDGLETFEGQVEWLLQCIRQLVNPDVKIVLSGHSWGGEFAAFMHRLSADPRFAQIERYISLSPPVDTSVGGDVRDKLKFDEWFEDHFADFVDKIAASDFEFHENMLNNGKDSDIGSFFTTLSNFDYSTPPLTREMQEKLKPLTLIVGTADGLVYVGREEAFQKVFGDLQAPSQFIPLGPGRTWKSKGENDLFPTGHNIFDRYIDGTTTAEVYKILGDLVLDGRGELETSDSTGDTILDNVDRFFRKYAGFFAFRIMIEQHPEFVQLDTEARSLISRRKGEIDQYLKQIQPLEVEIARIEESRTREVKNPIAPIQKAIDAFRARLGIVDNLTLKRAEEELAMPELTEERRAELQAYVSEVQGLEEEFKTSYHDVQHEQEIKQIAREFSKVMEAVGLTDVTQFRPVLEQYKSRKDLNSKEAQIRADLSRIEQRVAEAHRKKMGRFGVARDSMLAEVRTPPGVSDFKSAQRELSADRSPERRAKIEAFVAGYRDVEEQARLQAISDLRAQIASIPLPSAIESAEQAKGERERLESQLELTYVPEGKSQILPLANRVKSLTEELRHLIDGDERTLSLEKLQSNVKEARQKRQSLVKTWDGMWRKGELKSPALAELERSVERMLEDYKQIYRVYEDQKSQWLLSLRDSGRLNAEEIVAMTPELKSLRRKVQHAKQVYFKNRQELETLRVVETLGARLEGPEGMIKEAARVAEILWGKGFAATRRPVANSLTNNMRLEEEYLDNRLAQISVLEQELGDARAAYTGAMLAAGEQVPYTISRIQLADLLDQPLEDLIAHLRADSAALAAMNQALQRWESFQARLRVDAQAKDKDSAGY